MKNKKSMRKENAMKNAMSTREREDTFFLDRAAAVAGITADRDEEIGFFESADDDPVSMPLLLHCDECGTDNIHVEVTEDYCLIITCRECGSRKRYEE
jgi:hypothetical protein